MAAMKESHKEISPLDEKQDKGVTMKLGKTHYEALERWSKERFGLANLAGLVRLLIHEKWEAERAAANGPTEEAHQ